MKEKNSQATVVTKLNFFNCDKIRKKYWDKTKNSNCDKAQKLKFLPNLKKKHEIWINLEN